MIQFKHISKIYPGSQGGLRDINLDIQAGEMVFLTGHSGAGKSTLLRLIALMDRADRGQLIVNGQSVKQIRKRKIPYFRRQLGMIFQDHRLLLDRSVFDNVALPLVVSGMDERQIKRRVQAALDKVGLLKKKQLLPAVLSAGEQQRVGIARAIVSKPPIVLADEPTGNLDPDLSVEIIRLFYHFNQVGVTLLIATHDHALVRLFKQRTLVLKQGRLIADEKKDSYHRG